MKRLSILSVILGVLGVLVAACGSSSPAAPTTPTNPTFTAALSPANEVPAIVGAEASGSGSAVVTLVTTKDGAGNVTSATASFVVNLSGFPAGTPINIAHIHQAGTGLIGSVVVNSLITAGQNTLTNGSGSFTAANLVGDPGSREPDSGESRQLLLQRPLDAEPGRCGARSARSTALDTPKNRSRFTRIEAAAV